MKSSLSKPIFSVVMPMYNVEKYVSTAIESVLSQSFEEFELICVDDGCTDRTLQIASSFEDPRVRIVQQKNRGLSGARNTGINNCQGIYIAFLDSDDFWHSEKLATHLAHFRDNPRLGVSYSASSFIDEDDRELGIGQHPKIRDISAADIFCRNPIGNGSAPVIRHSVFVAISRSEIINGEKRITYFDESMRQSEDVELWLRIALTTDWKFEGIKKSLTYYRVNASGLSANLNKQFEAWNYSVNKGRSVHEDFYKKWYSLACAYQKRYLARRAVQSRNGFLAVSLINDALLTNWKILRDEPIRTLVTYGCAILCVLPNCIYEPIERLAMRSSQKKEDPALKSKSVLKQRCSG